MPFLKIRVPVEANANFSVSCRSMLGPILSQGSSCWPMLCQVCTKLAPSGHKFAQAGPSWPQVGQRSLIIQFVFFGFRIFGRRGGGNILLDCWNLFCFGNLFCMFSLFFSIFFFLTSYVKGSYPVIGIPRQHSSKLKSGMGQYHL